MRVEHAGLAFSRPGHATVRIETQAGRVVYLDPFSEILTDRPRDGDYVLVSHDDWDHYDPDGIEAVAKADATVVAFEAIDTSDLEYEVITVGEGETVTVDDLSVTGTPAYNEPDGPHLRPTGEPYHPRGTVIGFLVDIDETTVWYPSDTDALDDHTTITADVVIPPIGGRPTMDRHEAAQLLRDINPALVLPVHYNSDIVDDIETDPQAFKRDLEPHGIRVELF